MAVHVRCLLWLQHCTLALACKLLVADEVPLIVECTVLHVHNLVLHAYVQNFAVTAPQHMLPENNCKQD